MSPKSSIIYQGISNIDSEKLIAQISEHMKSEYNTQFDSVHNYIPKRIPLFLWFWTLLVMYEKYMF